MSFGRDNNDNYNRNNFFSSFSSVSTTGYKPNATPNAYGSTAFSNAFNPVFSETARLGYAGEALRNMNFEDKMQQQELEHKLALANIPRIGR